MSVKGMRLRAGYGFAGLVALFAAAVPAFGQEHGVGINQACDGPICPGDPISCTFSAVHTDGFGDATLITGAFSTVDPGGSAQRIPAVGSLPIINVAGNATFNCRLPNNTLVEVSTDEDCAALSGTPEFPVLIGPAGSMYFDPDTGLTLPGEAQDGTVQVFNDQFVVGALPNPLQILQSILWIDQCDVEPGQGCVPDVEQTQSSLSQIDIGGPDCDPPMEPERGHPGWNRVSTEITLTPNQPTYWSAFSGTGSMGGLNPITVAPFPSLDPDPTGTQPGRPCPDGSDERCLRGFIVAWAVDSENEEIAYNQLSGSATIVDYERPRAWEYSAWTHQSVGPVTGDGVLNLDGTEYSPGFDLLLMGFYAGGSTPFATNSLQATLQGDLTLHPLEVDARQGSTPLTTKAVIDLWNENEVKFDGLERCITCWDQTLFRDYAGFGIPNNLVNLQTNYGKARIDGRAGDGVCDEFDETEGPCGTLSTDVCGEDAALIGLVAHFVECITSPPSPDVLGEAAFGKNLVGMGTQGATVRYTPLGGPPTATAPRRSRTDRGDALTRTSRTTTPSAAVGGPIQDRSSGTEKGSVLFISKVELRWNANNELIQDTFVSLINDGGEAVRIQMEFINGDPPLAPEIP